MNKHQNNKPTIDDELANFTDHILSENTTNLDEISFTSDPELLAIEKTALRLKNAFQDDGPSDIAIRRMRKNIVTQWKQKETIESEPIWKRWIPSNRKWQSQRSRQRFSMAISFAILFALMLISIPFINGTSTDQPATSVQSFNISLLVIFISLILLAIWISRRKR